MAIFEHCKYDGGVHAYKFVLKDAEKEDSAYQYHDKLTYGCTTLSPKYRTHRQTTLFKHTLGKNIEYSVFIWHL
jgi:hypothetical protein